MSSDLDNINILTWNSNSLKEKLNELKVSVINNNYNVIGVCETKLDKSHKICAPGFTIYRSDRNSRGGGVALFISSQIKHNQIVLPKLQSTEAVAVEIESNSSSCNNNSYSENLY